MKHFVSASCEGNLCSVCKAPAQHKLGEEIPNDEPCGTCGGTWRMSSAERGALTSFGNQTRGERADKHCADFYHRAESGVPRHNLTAYVCCAHFTMIVGPAAGCPPETVMHAGIMKEAAERLRVLEHENSEFRDALIDLCDDFCTHKNGKHFVRAIRAAANKTTVVFDMHAIRQSVQGPTPIHIDITRQRLHPWGRDWESVPVADVTDADALQWLAIDRNGETTEILSSGEDYIAELGAFIAWAVNTLARAVDEIERLR